MQNNVDFFLKGCETKITADGCLTIIAPSKLHLLGLRKSVEFANWLAEQNLIRANIFLPGLSKPFQISGSLGNQSDEDKLRAIAKLGNREILKAMEFVMECSKDKIVIITGMKTNLCKHTNDLLKPERGIRKPHEWTGYNYLKSWTLNDSGVPSEEYFKLIQLLERDKYVSGYEYTLRRPDDEALVRYRTDYLYVENWLGEPVRIGISRQEDYQVSTAGIAAQRGSF